MERYTITNENELNEKGKIMSPIREILYDPTEQSQEELSSPVESSDVRNVEQQIHAPVRESPFQTKKEAQVEAEKFLTLEQASKECGLSRGLFKKLVEFVKFPTVNIGKKIVLIKKSDLDKWVKALKSTFA